MIRNLISNKECGKAVKIFADAFVNDTLFLYSFPNEQQRKKATKIIYRFVVFELAPIMKLKLKGLFLNGNLVSVCTYTTPESYTGWTDKLEEAVQKMRKRVKSHSIALIGEYSIKSRKFKIEKPHFYFNELAVTPKKQGRGYGKMMFAYVESQCRKHSSAKSVWLDTPNPKNVEIYKHFGYIVRHKFKFRELTGFVMCKDIL